MRSHRLGGHPIARAIECMSRVEEAGVKAVSEVFDPYRKWFGIPTAEQPPDHYRLLAIAPFESDPDVIETAADLRISHLRTYKASPHSALSQRLHNEVEAAKLCLLDQRKKSEYDAELRRRIGETTPGPEALGAAQASPVAPVWPAAITVAKAEPQPIVSRHDSTSPLAVHRQPTRVKRIWPQVLVLATCVAGAIACGAFYAHKTGRQPTAGGVRDSAVLGVPRKESDRHESNALLPGGGSTKDDTSRVLTERSEAPPPAKFAATSVVSADAQPPEREAKDQAPSDNPFDVLRRIDPKRDAVVGDCRLVDGKLLIPALNQARLELPCETPAEYVLEAVVEFDSIAQGLVMGLVVNDTQTMAVLDCWRNAISGLVFVDGRDANINPTCRRGDFLVDGRPNRIVCEVRKTGVRINCNDALIVNWRSGSGALSLPAWWAVRDPRRLFLGSDGTAFRVTKLELKPLVSGTASSPSIDASAATPLTERKRPPLPGPELLQSAERKAADLFGEEVRRSTASEAKLVTARRILERARWGQDENPVRYVLARQAQELATSAGDAVSACRALELIVAAYDVGDLTEARANAVAEACRAAQSDETRLANRLLALSVAEDALQAERFSAAKSLLQAARAADSTQNQSLRDRLSALERSIPSRERRFDTYNQALATLQKQPDNNSANLAAGRYEILVRGDWKSGAARWAKLDDPALDELLRLDAEAYQKPEMRVAAARAWWNAATPAGKMWKYDYQLQAQYWRQRVPDSAVKPSADAAWMAKLSTFPGCARNRFRSGVAAELYDGADFRERRVRRIDRHVDWAFGDGSPDPKLGADWFSIRWTGCFTPPVSGKWRLFLHTDNGVRLWIDDRKVLDFWNPDVHDQSLDLLLTDQPHTFRLEYSEFWGGAAAEWSWCLLDGGERGRQPLPPEAFTYEPALPYEDPLMPDDGASPASPSAQSLTGARTALPRATCNPCEFGEVIGQVAPGFSASLPVDSRGFAIVSEHFGRQGVLQTHPVDPKRPCVLTATVDVPGGKNTWLNLDVSHHPAGDWQLVVKANGRQLYDGVVGPGSVKNGWQTVSVNLTEFAGKTATIELHNQPNGWRFEFGYWGRVQVVTR